MKCPKCKVETYRKPEPVVLMDGEKHLLLRCKRCKTIEVTKKKRMRRMPIPDSPKNPINGPDGIRYIDNELTRRRDSVDKREVIFSHGDGSKMGFRNNRVMAKLNERFKGKPFKIVSDNGWKVVAEATGAAELER